MARNTPKNTLTTREEFYAREQRAWDAFYSTWSDLPDEALLAPGACGPEWTVKDVINHTAAWQEGAFRVIQNLLAGRWVRGQSTEKFNQANYIQDRDRPLDESRERLLGSRLQLLRLLESVTDVQLLNEFGRQQIGWWAKWTTYGHYEQHLEELRAFRKQFEAG